MRPASEAVSEAPRKRARASPESFSEVTSSGHAGDQSFSHPQQIACECPSGLSFSEIARLRADLLARCGAPQAGTPEAFAFSILEKRPPSREDVLLLAHLRGEFCAPHLRLRGDVRVRSTGHARRG